MERHLLVGKTNNFYRAPYKTFCAAAIIAVQKGPNEKTKLAQNTMLAIIGSIIFFVIQNKQNTIENIQWKDFIVVMVLT